MGQDDKQPAKEAGMKDASAVSTGADVRVVRPQRQATQVAVRSHSGSKILGTFGKNKGKESETAERVKGTRAPVATKPNPEADSAGASPSRATSSSAETVLSTPSATMHSQSQPCSSRTTVTSPASQIDVRQESSTPGAETGADSNAGGAEDDEAARQKRHAAAQKKRNQRAKVAAEREAGLGGLKALANAAAASASSTAASALDTAGSTARSVTEVVKQVIAYTSPDKPPNWKTNDNIRLILAACTPDMELFLKRLGETGDRLEAEVNISHSHVLPDDQFFTQLELKFNDPTFAPTVPWSADKRLNVRRCLLEKRRDVTKLRTEWFKMLSLYETAINKYNRSGQPDEDTGRIEEGRCCLWEMFMFTVLNPVSIKTPLAS
jgi:hypothetical protein